MRAAVALAAVCLGLLASPVCAAEAAPREGSAAPALDPEAIALGHDILEVLSPQAERMSRYNARIKGLTEQIRASALAGLDAENPALKVVTDRSMDRMWAELGKVVESNLPGFYEAYARAYARRFSLQELREIKAFAMTAAGRKYLHDSTTLFQDPDVIVAQQRLMDSMTADMPRLQKQMKDEVAAVVAKSAAKPN